MWRCEKCKEFQADNIKECSCKEYTIIKDGEEHKLWANHMEHAALRFAEDYNDNGDHSLMGEEIYIEVRDAEGKTTKFCISAEPDIHYSAVKIWEDK